MTWTLITGGAKRLGADIALCMAKNGRNVLIQYDTSLSEAKALAKQCREYKVHSEIVQGNFSEIATTKTFIDSVAKKFGSIDTLINNVGPYLIKSAESTDIDEWTHIFQTNLHAPFALIHGFLPSIIKSKGNIINIGVAGINSARATMQRSAYLGAKSALLVLTKSLARELAPKGVRVNMVSPGYLDNSLDLPLDILSLPMGRAAISSEISRVILFLLDPASGYITGQNIEVSGGVNL